MTDRRPPGCNYGWCTRRHDVLPHPDGLLVQPWIASPGWRRGELFVPGRHDRGVVTIDCMPLVSLPASKLLRAAPRPDRHHEDTAPRADRTDLRTQ